MPGASGSFDTQQNNQGFDPMQFLQSIIQSASAAGQAFMNPNMVNQNQQPSNPSQQQALNQAVTNQVAGPYQEGVNKALKEAGQQHVVEAIQAGMSPQDIQNHPIMNGGQQSQSIPANNLNVNQGKGMGLGGANLDQQGNVNVNMPSILGRILFGNSLVNQDLNTISGAQKVSGQEPIQPMEKAQVQAGINTATLQSMNDANQRLQNYRDQLTKEFTAEAATIPDWQKGVVTKLTPRMKEIQDQLKDINISQGQLLNSFMSYKPTNIMNKVKEINSKYSNAPAEAIAEARKRGLIK